MKGFRNIVLHLIDLGTQIISRAIRIVTIKLASGEDGLACLLHLSPEQKQTVRSTPVRGCVWQPEVMIEFV